MVVLVLLNKKGRGQKAEGTEAVARSFWRPGGSWGLSPPLKSLIQRNLFDGGLNPPSKFFPSALCLLPSAFLLQLRLWLSAMAYVLMQAFRQHCLARTSPAKATVGTVRLALLKLGAKITVSVRRVLIAIASACPYQDILAIAYQRLQAISDSG